MSKMDKIMLRFRPIAPKPLPAAAAALSDASSSESTGSAKRKDNTASKRCSRGIRRRRNAPPPPPPPPPAVTLPLLPETPDPKKTTSELKNKNVPVWLSFENSFKNRGGTASEKVDPCWYSPAAGSVVTVECVMDRWQPQEEGLGLGRGDVERKVKLEEDTCPGFISDGYGRVTWTNGAYREIMGEGGVWLAMKVTVPCLYRGFTCRVRVQYACGKERTVPCDVWRMNSGGFAWRLDVKAALSLSLAL